MCSVRKINWICTNIDPKAFIWEVHILPTLYIESTNYLARRELGLKVRCNRKMWYEFFKLHKAIHIGTRAMWHVSEKKKKEQWTSSATVNHSWKGPIEYFFSGLFLRQRKWGCAPPMTLSALLSREQSTSSQTTEDVVTTIFNVLSSRNSKCYNWSDNGKYGAL